MLKEIRCKIFRTGKVEFHPGLNVVLGDENAANSIGKSSMLMVVDFAFGGTTYIDYNKDVVSELGHHEIQIEFAFGDTPFYFTRNTEVSDSVFQCDGAYNVINTLSASDYSAFLKKKYGLTEIELSFRDIVSLYSRVWGKPNQFIKKPLQLFDKETEKDSVIKLIKLFKRYGAIKNIVEKLRKEQEVKSSFQKAVKNDLLPKVTKTENVKNTQVIERLENELEDIQNNILKYTINVSEIVNRELLELKREKDKLLRLKLNFQSRKERLEANLREASPLKPKHLEQLRDYFPNSNVSKIETIEAFHSKLSKILRGEFANELSHTISKLNIVLSEIEEIDVKIAGLLGNTDNPINVVNRIYNLTYQARDLKLKKETFERKVKIDSNILEWSGDLDNVSGKITSEIEGDINRELIDLNKRVHNEPRTPPTFQLQKDKYSFELLQNTGTGKAFINLIMFDLAIFRLTGLPFIVHDSFLFKNIEVSSTENLISIYQSFNKQCFIALDELSKYRNEAQEIMLTSRCLQLDNSNLLYTKDWRERGNASKA